MNDLTGISPHDRKDWMDFKNTGSTTIPPHGVIEIEDAQSDDSNTVEYLKGKRPTSHYIRTWAINGPMEVAANDYGLCCNSGDCYGRINTSDVPVLGETLGPKKDSFDLQHAFRGVTVNGDINASSSGLARVAWPKVCPHSFRFYNSSGYTVSFGSVLTVSATDVTKDGDNIIYEVARPAASVQRICLVSISDDVADGAYGWAEWLLDAPGWVAYDTGSATPSRGDSWGIKSAQFTLVKNRAGFLVVGGNKTVNGISCFHGIQQPVTRLRGKIDAPITAGSTGTVSVYDGAWVDTSVDITVNNDFADLDTVDTKVFFEDNSGSWSIYAAGC